MDDDDGGCEGEEAEDGDEGDHQPRDEQGRGAGASAAAETEFHTVWGGRVSKRFCNIQRISDIMTIGL